MGMQEATQFASIGNFSANILSRQLPGAKSKEDKIVQNTSNTVKEIVKLGGLISGMPGMAFAP